MATQRRLPVTASVAVAVAAPGAPRRRVRLLAFGFLGLVGFWRSSFGWWRRRHGTFARFGRLGVVPVLRVAMAVTVPAGAVTLTVPVTFVSSRWSLRAGRGLRRGLSHRARRRGSAGNRCYYRRRRGGSRSGLLNDRRRIRGRLFGRTATGRACGSRMGGDEIRGLRGLRLGQGGSATRASPWLARGDPGARSAAGGGDCPMNTPRPRPRCDRGIADRLALASKAGNRRPRNQRPALVERESDHRQADRSGRTKQRQRSAAGPLEQSAAKNAPSDGR